MNLVADVKLGWTKSPSADVAKVRVTVTSGGTDTVSEFGPEVQAMQITVAAMQSVQFKVQVENSEGLTAISEIHSFNLGDLQAPAPATGLFHQVLAVRDLDAPAPAPAIAAA